MSKKKSEPVLELEPDERQDMAVSIMPQIKNNRVVFEIVRFVFNSNGTCGKPEIVHSTINEATAITLMFQTAHETLGVKELRQIVKKLKGGKK